MTRFPVRFYRNADTLSIARQLLGCIFCTRLPAGNRVSPVLTSVRITEVEAYTGPEDRASHAYGNRRTPRTETMFKSGGVAYIYLCYGMHHLFNVVTGCRDVPQAVLIRAGEPVAGENWMRLRRGMAKTGPSLTTGPGRLAKALGLDTGFNGTSLCGNRIWIEPGDTLTPRDIQATPRIGVAYAGDDAHRPYRFLVRDTPWVTPTATPALG